MDFLRLLESFRGMLERFLGLFVPAQMVAFPVMLHRASMCVRGKLMKFSGFAMRIVHVI